MDRQKKIELFDSIDQWVNEQYAKNCKILVITPDSTRSSPLNQIVPYLQKKLIEGFNTVDYLVALGTHKKMSHEDIQKLYGLTKEDFSKDFKNSTLYNHEWDKPETFIKIGTIPASEMIILSEGHLKEDLDIFINRMVYKYDRVMVVSPVFPHEVVGFSGGVKYFFPGISGGDFVQKFHWLGGVLGSTQIIGQKETTTRSLIEKAGEFLNLDVSYLTLVISQGDSFEGAFFGSHDEAWNRAADLSSQVNIKRLPGQFQTVIGIAPSMFDEIWTAGKVMYKLERMVAPGGRLIIFGPHIHTISYTWGKWIEKVGYHTRDYLLAHPELMEGVPPGIFAQSCYVKGMGTYKNGKEYPRIDVTLSTGLSEETCRKVNLSYIDPNSIDVDNYRNRENEGILVVDNAGEVLFLPDKEEQWL